MKNLPNKILQLIIFLIYKAYSLYSPREQIQVKRKLYFNYCYFSNSILAALRKGNPVTIPKQVLYGFRFVIKKESTRHNP